MAVVFSPRPPPATILPTMPRRPRKQKSQPVAPPPPPPATVSARVRWLCACGVFVALLLVYRLTIIPTMVDQDSGELVAAAHVLGIAHPTGYPLWTMLGRLFDLLPLGGTSAYRVAMLSATSAAAGGAVLTWLVMTLSGAAPLGPGRPDRGPGLGGAKAPGLPGVFAGLAFGLWFPTWSQAVRAEVYALSGLLFTLFLLALFRWDRDRSRRSFHLLALAGGFVCMHHRTAFLAVAPALAMGFWFARPRRTGTWIPAALLCVAPFLCYLYLPIRAAARPPVNWTNPITLDRFLWHALGRQYTHFALENYSRPDVLTQQAGRLLGESLTGNAAPSILLALIGVPLIVWGFVTLYRRRRDAALSLGAGAVALVIWVLGWGETSDLKVFLTPLGAVLALYGGMGLAKLEVSRANGRLLAATAGGAIALLLLTGNWARSDQSGIWEHRDRWAAVLSQMDKNAIFVTDFDVPSFATLYLQNVEGLRKDITSLRTVGMMQPWYVDLIQDEELRHTADQAWKEVSAQLGITGSGTPQFWQGSALFAWRLAQHYRGRRPVYALHGPYMGEIPGPPYFVGLSEDLVKLDFARPEMLRKDARKPIATFPGGLELVSFDLLSGREVGAGSLVPFRAVWRTNSPLANMQFAVRLVPAEKSALLDKGRFLQGFPLLYGQRDLSPSPPGTAYEQRGTLIIPSNAGARAGVGTFTVEVGLSDVHPPEYGQWVEVLNRDNELIAKNRHGFPANGP